MKKQTKKTLAVIGAVVAGAGLALGGGLVGASMFPKVITNDVLVPFEVPVVVNNTVTEYVDVPVEKIVNNTVYEEVLVDNGNLDLVQDFIYDTNGNMNFITNDLDNDEIDMIVDRIVYVNDNIQIGSEYIKDNFADEIDKEEFDIVGTNDSVEFDEDDVKKVKIKDDLDEIAVFDVDFEDNQIEVIYNVFFEHDDVDYKAVVKVSIEDNEVDDFEVITITSD